MESASKGAIEGFLDWTSEKVQELVGKLQNRKLAFVEDEKNVKVVRAQRESTEYNLLRKFVPKGYLLILFQMGLALREMERDQRRVEALKDDIFRRHGTAGVHITELVQIGVTTELLTRLVRISKSESDVQKRLTAFLDQVDFLTLFVRKEDGKNIAGQARLVRNRVDASPTHMMIVFGSGYAKKVVLDIIGKLRNDPRNYLIEIHDEGFQITAFVFAPELRSKLTHWTDTLSEDTHEAKRRR